MVSEKLLKVTTVVVIIVGIPLAILFWWGAYNATSDKTNWIISLIFVVLVYLGGSIGIHLMKRRKGGKPK